MDFGQILLKNNIIIIIYFTYTRYVVSLFYLALYKSRLSCKIIFYICYDSNIIKNKYILR